MTIDILRAGVDEQRQEKAREAVKQFRALQPTLTSYARMLTGNKKVRVEMAIEDNGSTDGTRIFFRPPIGLGDKTPHNRHLCDKRDDEGSMLCKACYIREEIIVTIMHEIAHIAFDTFQRVTAEDKRRAIEFAIKEVKSEWAEAAARRVRTAPKWKTQDYLNLASLINEFLPTIINALEDARVNAKMFEARPGLKRMFATDTARVFEEGFETREGTRNWKEAPQNMQAIVGLFCKASGYDYSDWFYKDVVAALDDDELTRLVDQVGATKSAQGIYNLSFKVLARLRELGFCGTPQDPDPEPEEEDEDDSQDQDAPSEGETGEPENGGERSEGDPGESAGEEGEGDDSGHEPGDNDASSSPEQGEGEADSDPSSDGSAESEDEDGSEAGSDDSSEDVLESDGGGDSEEPEGEDVDEQEGAGSGSDSEDSGSDSDGNSDPSAGERDADGADEDSDAGEDAPGEGSSDADHEPDSDSRESAGEAPGEEQLDGTDSEDSAGEGEASSEGETGVPPVPSPGEPGREEDESSDTGPAPEGGGTGIESERTTPEGEDSDAPREESSEDEDSGEEDAPDPDGESDDEPIDTGADDGYGGTSVEEDDAPPPPMGDPWEVTPVLQKWGDHEKPKSSHEAAEQKADDREVQKAVVQGIYFTKPSQRIFGVREHFYGSPVIQDGVNYSLGWKGRRNSRAVGQSADLDVPEGILQPALLKMRRAFSDNQRGAWDTNRRSGHINGRVLGRRAWSGDDRLFHKKVMPGKKNYFVVIGMDISGSTVGKNIALEKRAIMAQATLLDRVGVPFAIYAHTGNYADGYNTGAGMNLEVYHVKDANEPWNEKTIERLEQIGPCAANLDGHALEYLRKRADESNATDKIIMYYSDGKMPQENHDEELDILQSEIRTCASKNYTLLGVGIRTDSPKRHGLDTVEVHEDTDLQKVVDHLGRRLSAVLNR